MLISRFKNQSDWYVLTIIHLSDQHLDRVISPCCSSHYPPHPSPPLFLSLFFLPLSCWSVSIILPVYYVWHIGTYLTHTDLALDCTCWPVFTCPISTWIVQFRPVSPPPPVIILLILLLLCLLSSWSSFLFLFPFGLCRSVCWYTRCDILTHTSPFLI